MRLVTRLAAAGAVCLALTSTPHASAEPFEHFTFHEEFDSTNDCGDGLVLEAHDVLDGRVVAVRHGDGLVYYTQHSSLTAVVPVPGTDVSLTVVNKGLVGHDVHITDNGDGTVTVRQISPARVAVLGPDGRTVSHFSGLATYDLLVDQAGTPSDPTDDELLAVLGSTLHGHFDAPGLCELARRYAS